MQWIVHLVSMRRVVSVFCVLWVSIRTNWVPPTAKPVLMTSHGMSWGLLTSHSASVSHVQMKRERERERGDANRESVGDKERDTDTYMHTHIHTVSHFPIR